MAGEYKADEYKMEDCNVINNNYKIEHLSFFNQVIGKCWLDSLIVALFFTDDLREYLYKKLFYWNTNGDIARPVTTKFLKTENKIKYNEINNAWYIFNDIIRIALEQISELNSVLKYVDYKDVKFEKGNTDVENALQYFITDDKNSYFFGEHRKDYGYPAIFLNKYIEYLNAKNIIKLHEYNRFDNYSSNNIIVDKKAYLYIYKTGVDMNHVITFFKNNNIWYRFGNSNKIKILKYYNLEYAEPKSIYDLIKGFNLLDKDSNYLIGIEYKQSNIPKEEQKYTCLTRFKSKIDNMEITSNIYDIKNDNFIDTVVRNFVYPIPIKYRNKIIKYVKNKYILALYQNMLKMKKKDLIKQLINSSMNTPVLPILYSTTCKYNFTEDDIVNTIKKDIYENLYVDEYILLDIKITSNIDSYEIMKQKEELYKEYLNGLKKQIKLQFRICPYCTLKNKDGALKCELCDESLIGGNINKYYAKYIKYKLKYINLKNNN